MQTYPDYVESDVEWIGKVPASWEVRRISSVAALVNGGTPSTNRLDYWSGDILWVTRDDLGKLKGRFVSDSAAPNNGGRLQVLWSYYDPADSLAVSTRAPIGHLGSCDQRAASTKAVGYLYRVAPFGANTCTFALARGGSHLHPSDREAPFKSYRVPN